MKRLKIFLCPSYDGNRFQVEIYQNEYLNGQLYFLREVLNPWQELYDKMIEEESSKIEAKVIEEFGLSVVQKLNAKFHGYRFKVSSLFEIIDQMARDLYLKATEMQEANESPKALLYFEKRYFLNTLDTGYLRDYAFSLMQNEQYEKAIDCLKRILNKEDLEPIVLYNIAFCYFSLRQYTRAEYFFDQLLAINPLNTNVITLASMNYNLLGNHGKSIKLLERALRSSPYDLDLRKELASSYKMNGQYDQERKVLLQIIKAGTKDKEVYKLLGESYTASGQKYKAIEALKEVIRLDPDDGVIYYRIARLYSELNLENFAADMYLKAILKNPDFTKYFWGSEKFLISFSIEKDLLKNILEFGALYGDQSAKLYSKKTM